MTPGGGGAGGRGAVAGAAAAGGGGRISLANQDRQQALGLDDNVTDIQYSIRSVFRSVDSSARRFPAQEVAISRRVCGSESQEGREHRDCGRIPECTPLRSDNSATSVLRNRISRERNLSRNGRTKKVVTPYQRRLRHRFVLHYSVGALCFRRCWWTSSEFLVTKRDDVILDWSRRRIGPYCGDCQQCWRSLDIPTDLLTLPTPETGM